MAAAGRTCTCCGATTTSSLLPTPHCPNCGRAREGRQGSRQVRLTLQSTTYDFGLRNQRQAGGTAQQLPMLLFLPCPPKPPTSPPTLFQPDAYSRPSRSAASVCRQPPATRATSDTAATRLGMYTSLQGGGEEERLFVQSWQAPWTCRQPAYWTLRQRTSSRLQQHRTVSTFSKSHPQACSSRCSQCAATHTPAPLTCGRRA